MNKKVRTAFRWFGIIFLGAVGSGLWAKFGEKLWEWCADSAITVFSFLYTGYVNSLYTKAALGNYSEMVAAHTFDLTSMLLIIFMCHLIVAIAFSIDPFIILRKTVVDPKDVKIYTENLKRFFSWFYYVALVCVFIAVIDNYFSELTMRSAKNIDIQTSKSIEIIKPYIPDSTITRLRSDYLQVRTKEQYMEVIQIIQHVADREKLTLPEFWTP